MIKRFSFLALAAVLALALSSSAQAAPTNVYSDSGLGYGTATGTATGASFQTTTTASTPAAPSDPVLNGINGAGITPPMSLHLNETVTAYTQMTIGGVKYDFISAGSGSKTFDEAGATVTLTFTITSGIATLGHFNTNGMITSVSSPSTLSGYEFATLVGGTVTIGVDQNNTDFTSVLGHTGVKAVNATLGLTENAAVPEPASMALLGIGITGLVAFRRLFKRAAKA